MAALCSAGTSVYAHTVVSPNTVNEGATADLNMVIGHGCKDANGAAIIPITAESAVFPDPVSGTLTKAVPTGDAATPGSYQPVVGPYTDHFTFVTHSGTGGGMQAVQSNNVFDKKTVLEKSSPNGVNTLGYSYRGGKLPGTVAGFIPFRLDKITFPATSCAKSVTFKISVADICKNAPKAQFSAQTVNFWGPNLGADKAAMPFQGAEFSPASLKVVRTSANTCDPANQFDLIVWPTADQLNRDMPIPNFWGNK